MPCMSPDNQDDLLEMMTVEMKTPRNSPSHYDSCFEGSEFILSGGGSWEKLDCRLTLSGL